MVLTWKVSRLRAQDAEKASKQQCPIGEALWGIQLPLAEKNFIVTMDYYSWQRSPSVCVWIPKQREQERGVEKQR
jgi:hypothetical protein